MVSEKISVVYQLSLWMYVCTSYVCACACVCGDGEREWEKGGEREREEQGEKQIQISQAEFFFFLRNHSSSNVFWEKRKAVSQLLPGCPPGCHPQFPIPVGTAPTAWCCALAWHCAAGGNGAGPHLPLSFCALRNHHPGWTSILDLRKGWANYIHLTQQILFEHLICARHYTKCWVYKSKEPCPL